MVRWHLLHYHSLLFYHTTIVPDELKERMKESEMGKSFNIESKLSLREKQKAKAEMDKKMEQNFYRNKIHFFENFLSAF